jgi:hypothetical protein
MLAFFDIEATGEIGPMTRAAVARCEQTPKEQTA